MNTQVDSVGVQPQADARPYMLVAVLALAVIGLYWQTAWSMVDIWLRSETFAHGFLILPISLWLVWRRRGDLAVTPVESDWRGVLGLALLGLGWLSAQAASVQVFQQLFFVAMLPMVVWACLGWGVVRVVLFPMIFLLFSVPMGEELIPPLMDFTASFTVWMLRLTGIPVFWEGTYFSIPSGNWSVVEGCSGVRYLIASVTMGSLYAYLSYRSYWRRGIFILLSIAVPIVANGLRAYMIVMIAHLSGMKLALGVDHYIYGWVFFGVVMLLLFWIGAIWSEPEAESLAQPVSGSESGKNGGLNKGIVGITVAMVLVWPLWSHLITSDTAGFTDREYRIAAPVAEGRWQVRDNSWADWKPRYISPDAELQMSFTAEAKVAGLYLARYGSQRQGAELINSQNVMVEQKHPVWRQVENRVVDVEINGKPFTVRQARLKSSQQNLLIWSWYWLDGTHTSNRYLAKLTEAAYHLLGKQQNAVGIVAYVAYEHAKDDSDQQLQAFLGDMLGAVETSLVESK